MAEKGRGSSQDQKLLGCVRDWEETQRATGERGQEYVRRGPWFSPWHQENSGNDRARHVQSSKDQIHHLLSAFVYLIVPILQASWEDGPHVAEKLAVMIQLNRA